jgi:hypothetical protein
MASEFNIDDLVNEITGGDDSSSTTTVTVADGEASKTKSKSGLSA